VSCNPSGQPATSDARLAPLNAVEANQASGEMVIHNLSSDGSKVFFETEESLLHADIDGINDIYEWQQAGSASEKLGLISSGTSVSYPPLIPISNDIPRPNIILAIDPSGNNVFFHSLDQLLPQAPGEGSSVIYDARVGGGFPQPPAPVPCSEATSDPPCRGAFQGLPRFASPPSQRATGTGNLKGHHRRCRRARPGKKRSKKHVCRRHRRIHKHQKNAKGR
jgi:hypothetical protein